MSNRPDIKENVDQHRFEIDLGNGKQAFVAYTVLPGSIRFTHTEVPQSHGGQGIGTDLVEFSLADARKRDLKVIPLCPFISSYLRKHPEHQDLVDPEYRHLLEE